MTVAIVDARAKLHAALASMDEPVHDSPPDAVVPPCVMLGWGIPMIEWGTQQSRCLAFGNLLIILVGARLELGSGVEAIELMYDSVQRLLRLDDEGWSLRPDGGIVPSTIGNAPYLTCRVEVRVPLAI